RLHRHSADPRRCPAGSAGPHGLRRSGDRRTPPGRRIHDRSGAPHAAREGRARRGFNPLMKRLWEISTTECAGSREAIMLRGNVYQIANGAMGCRGTLDEFGPDEAVGVTLAGIYDQVGTAWREPVNAPNAAYTRVTLDGVGLSALDATVVAHRQTLHFEN